MCDLSLGQLAIFATRLNPSCRVNSDRLNWGDLGRMACNLRVKTLRFRGFAPSHEAKSFVARQGIVRRDSFIEFHCGEMDPR